jgi:hypothetical protein
MNEAKSIDEIPYGLSLKLMWTWFEKTTKTHPIELSGNGLRLLIAAR